MNKLKGKHLTVLNIYRTDLFSGNAFAHICENCGRTIINNAEVRDDAGNTYIIGLDCKKTLIDKKVLDEILELNEWDKDYKAKEYKSAVNEVSKFLKLVAYPNTKVQIDGSGWITIEDTEKKNQFGFKGEIIYSQNVYYLYKHGLKNFIQKLHSSNQLTLTK